MQIFAACVAPEPTLKIDARRCLSNAFAKYGAACLIILIRSERECSALKFQDKIKPSTPRLAWIFASQPMGTDFLLTTNSFCSDAAQIFSTRRGLSYTTTITQEVPLKTSSHVCVTGLKNGLRECLTRKDHQQGRLKNPFQFE